MSDSIIIYPTNHMYTSFYSKLLSMKWRVIVICLLNNNLVSTIFDNSQKTQKFMELVLKPYCPNTRHEKLKGLCKTRWVERHFRLKTFGEGYEHLVTWCYG